MMELLISKQQLNKYDQPCIDDSRLDKSLFKFQQVQEVQEKAHCPISKLQKLSLINHDLAQYYTELQSVTMRLEELQNIAHNWQIVTDLCIKNVTQIILTFFFKISEKINKEGEYQKLKKKVHYLTQVLTHTERLKNAEEDLLVDKILKKCENSQQMIEYADKHSMKNVVTKAIQECIQKKLKGQKFKIVLDDLLNFIQKYSRPLVYQRFVKFIEQFKDQVANFQINYRQLKKSLKQQKNALFKFATQQFHQHQDVSDANLHDLNAQEMNIRIDLQIISAQIIEDFQALIMCGNYNEHQNSHNLLIICQQYIKNFELKKLISLILTNYLSPNLDPQEQQEQLLVNKYLRSIYSPSCGNIKPIQYQKQSDIYENSQCLQTKRQKINQTISQYVEYKLIVYQSYQQTNSPEADQNKNSKQVSLQKRIDRTIFMERFENEIIQTIKDYLTKVYEIREAEIKIAKLQQKIQKIKIEQKKLAQNQHHNYPLQISSSQSKSINQTGVCTKYSESNQLILTHRTQNTILHNNTGLKTYTKLKKNSNQVNCYSFRVLKQLHISQTLKHKENVKLISRGQKIEHKKNKERDLILANKALILSKISPHCQEEIQIKRIFKIVKVGSQSLNVHFKKGYMELKFVDDENTDHPSLDLFMRLFIELYADDYPNIIFQNKWLPKNRSTEQRISLYQEIDRC